MKLRIFIWRVKAVGRRGEEGNIAKSS
jgi:hypothetical protein